MYLLVPPVNGSLWEALGGRDISKGWEDRFIEYGKDGFIALWVRLNVKKG